MVSKTGDFKIEKNDVKRGGRTIQCQGFSESSQVFFLGKARGACQDEMDKDICVLNKLAKVIDASLVSFDEGFEIVFCKVVDTARPLLFLVQVCVSGGFMIKKKVVFCMKYHDITMAMSIQVF